MIGYNGREAGSQAGLRLWQLAGLVRMGAETARDRAEGLSDTVCGVAKMTQAEQAESDRAEQLPPERPGAPNGEAVPGRRVWFRRLLAIGLGLALAVFVPYNVAGLLRHGRTDKRFEPQGWVDLGTPAQSSHPVLPTQPSDEHVLRVAVAPVISPERALGVYREFADYLGARLGRQAVLIQRDSYAEINEVIRFGRCELALVCTYAFVMGERDFDMQALVVPQVNGATTYHSLILVPRNSEARSLLDLRAKRFASADLLSNSGWLYPAVWLMERGEDPDTFFGEHMITGSHDRSVTAVVSGFADGAAVDSLVYDQMVAEDPTIAQKLRIVFTSPPFGMPPVVVPRQLKAELRDQIKMALLHMHEDASGREILKRLHIERFVVPEPGMFDSVREAAVKWKSRP